MNAPLHIPSQTINGSSLSHMLEALITPHYIKVILFKFWAENFSNEFPKFILKFARNI